MYEKAHLYFPEEVHATGSHQFRHKGDVLTYFLAAWIGIYEETAVRLEYEQHQSHMLINMKADININIQTLAKVMSPCLPSIQKKVCQKTGWSACSQSVVPEGVTRHRFVFDSVLDQCRGPIITIDSFATFKTLKSCVDECLVNRKINKGLASNNKLVPGNGAFTFLCIGDMAGDLSVKQEKALMDVLMGFFCEMFSVVPSWEKDNAMCSSTTTLLTKQIEFKQKATKTQIDIGIVAACVPRRFKTFTESISLHPKWRHRIRFIAMRYTCEDSTKEISYPASINGFKLETFVSEKPFSRSSIRNELMSHVRKNAIYISLDVDITLSNEGINNVLKWLTPGVIYFPIVWSMYSPTSIRHIAEKNITELWRFSDYEGVWRIWGYGIYAMMENDMVNQHFDTNYSGWGGEDDDFYRHAETNNRLKIKRDKDKGFVHRWHPKNCYKKNLAQKALRACLGSRSTYTSHKMGWMLMHDKLVEHDKILIVVPTCIILILILIILFLFQKIKTTRTKHVK